MDEKRWYLRVTPWTVHITARSLEGAIGSRFFGLLLRSRARTYYPSVAPMRGTRNGWR